MAVRNTESRIPEGLTAYDLGDAVVSDDQHYAMVSYLTSPLRRLYTNGPLRNQIKNTYVVFVDTNSVAPPAGYTWSVEFYSSENPFESDIPIYVMPETSSSDGVFPLDTSDMPLDTSDMNNLFNGKKISRIVVTVCIDSVTEPLELIQDVIDPDEDVESLIQERENDAGAGTPEVTRSIANHYSQYLIQQFTSGSSDNTTRKIPVHLGACILYYFCLFQDHWEKSLLQCIPSPFQSEKGEQIWGEYLNNGTADKAFKALLQKTPLGIMRIKPHVLSMSVGAPYMGLLIRDENEDQESYERRLLENYINNVNLDDQIDLFNLLRFPKSCLRVSGEYSRSIKDRFATTPKWDNLTDQDLLDPEYKGRNNDCIQRIVAEYENGPSPAGARMLATELGEFAADKMLTPYIQAIVETRYPEYEVIRIQLLDIRSGLPIGNARVKKLIVRGSDGYYFGVDEFDQQADEQGRFPYKMTKILGTESPIKGQPAIRNAQRALVRLNYARDENGKRVIERNNNYCKWCDGGWGELSSAAFNRYWAARFPDNPDLPQSTSDVIPPEDYLLRYIVKEYNNHAFTDENGILKVQIPKYFLQGRGVVIEVGFWEFPIVVERLLNEEQQNSMEVKPICRTSSPTSFQISWEGQQNSVWDDNLNNNHFGWGVSSDPQVPISFSMLKVALRLTIKDIDQYPFSEESAFNPDLLSCFYDTDLYPEAQSHFVLFGMQWCQPLVDGVEDNFDNEYRSNRVVFLNRLDSNGEWIKSLNLHIVTKYTGRSNYHYGFFDRLNPVSGQVGQHNYRGHAHDAVDIYSGVTGVTNCFAIHGGEFQNGPKSNYGEHNVFIVFKNPYSQTNDDRFKRFRYMHLSSRESLNEDIVLAGQIIGQTGREGNFEAESPSHLHLELLNSNQGARVSSMEPNRFLATHDPYNAKCLPSNKLPLMLPCACNYNYPAGSNDDPVGCDFLDSAIVSRCWAIQKYPDYDFQANRVFPNDEFPEQVVTDSIHMYACPFIHFNTFATPNTSVLSIQAHLKFVFVNRGRGTIPNLNYDPGPINNNLGNLPNNRLINLKAGDVVSVLDTDNDLRQVRIELNGNNGWILDLEAIINGGVMQVALQNVLTDKVVNDTRLAIGIYRSLAGDLNINLVNFRSNFDIDIALANSLRRHMITYADI